MTERKIGLVAQWRQRKETRRRTREQAERTSLAQSLYTDILKVQTDPIKTAITSPGIGSTFFPLPDGSVKEVHIASVDAFAFTSAKKKFIARGFNEDDLQNGVMIITQASRPDMSYAYTYGPSAAGEGEQSFVYVSGTGRVITRDNTSNDPEKYHELDRLDPFYLEAVSRVASLSQIPYHIREAFGTYAEFKHALGPADTIGLDTGASGPSAPWKPFLASEYLITFVDGYRADGTLNASYIDEGRSVVNTLANIQRIHSAMQ